MMRTTYEFERQNGTTEEIKIWFSGWNGAVEKARKRHGEVFVRARMLNDEGEWCN